MKPLSGGARRGRPPRSQAREAASAIDHRHIYGDASDTKRQLERFDSQVGDHSNPGAKCLFVKSG